MTTPPPVAQLETLLAILRAGSFTGAAQALGVTQGAVSRRIADLEEQLGLALFRRAGRRVVPTPAARRLAERTAPDLDRLSGHVAQAAAEGNDTEALRIACLPAFAERWLIPRLHDFERRHPGLCVHLGTRLAPFDFARESFDLAIHYGRTDWPDARLTHLCDERMAPVAAPGLAADLSGRSFQGLPLLHLESRPDAWAMFARQIGLPEDGTQTGRVLDQFALIVAAAVDGMGVALLPLYLIEGELAAGNLVALRDDVLRTEAAYFVALPAGQANPMAASFSIWVRSRIGRPIPSR